MSALRHIPLALLLLLSATAGIIMRPVSGGGGGGPTLLLDETFEGPGVVETWSGTWTDDQYATAPAPLAGSYSGRLTGAGEVEFDLGSLQTEIWVKFLIHIEGVVANGADVHILRIYDAAGTANGDVAGYARGVWGSSGQLRRWNSNHGYTVDAGTSSDGAVGSLEDDTTYWCWVRWTAETSGGAGDGTMTVYTHTSDDYTGRTQVTTTTNGGWDGAQRVAIRTEASEWEPLNIDSIQIANTDPQ